MEDQAPDIQETETLDPVEEITPEPTVEPEVDPAPEPVVEPAPNDVPVDAVAQALEEAAKPPVTLETLRQRQNLLYKEIKRYLQGRNDLRELAVLAEAFAGEGI